jgi:carbon-monoxide dehydrogenase medium subunit
VKPAPFAYTRAKTVKEAITLLARHKDDARLLAGGQSLIATLNMRLSAPDLLIDINGIKNLSGIAKKGKYIEVGALARHRSGRAFGCDRKARAPDRAGDAAYRPSGNPQPRHLRRLHCLCGSSGRAAGLPAGRSAARSRSRAARKRKEKPTLFSRACSKTALRPQEMITA